MLAVVLPVLADELIGTVEVTHEKGLASKIVPKKGAFKRKAAN